MKRIDFPLEGDMYRLAYPDHRIKTRDELLLIVLSSIRNAKVSQRLATHAATFRRVIFHIDDMQRVFFFDTDKFYTVTLPFTLRDTNNVVTFYYQGLEVSSYLLSKLIEVISDERFNSNDVLQFADPIDDNKVIDGHHFWSLVKYLMEYELGYVRYDKDEEEYQAALAAGHPETHPLHHLDNGYFNAGTYKQGLVGGIDHLSFIEIFDNKKGRWTLRR